MSSICGEKIYTFLCTIEREPRAPQNLIEKISYAAVGDGKMEYGNLSWGRGKVSNFCDKTDLYCM